jgi:hypothetical protein
MIVLREPAFPHFLFSAREFALSSARDVVQRDIADEAQKAETGPVFNKIWFMIDGGLEYLI